MSENILKLVGARIRDLRKDKGWSQEELGERAGFHFSYIGGIERAEKNISLLNLVKISDALGVDIYELFKYAEKLGFAYQTKETEIHEILGLLLQQEIKDIKRAKNILKEIFSTKD